MNLTIKELLIAIAFIGLGLAFALHMHSTNMRLDGYELDYRHSVAFNTCESRVFLVRENFRRARYTLLFNSDDFSSDRNSGCFEYSYAWSANGNPPLSGLEFTDMIRPVTEGFTNTSRTRWTVETEPSLKWLQSNPDQKSGTILFRVNYLFVDQVEIPR